MLEPGSDGHFPFDEYDGKDEPGPMNTNEWRARGKEMVDYIAGYMDTISDRRVTPAVEPGYLNGLIPDSAPYKAEDWHKIMDDFEKVRIELEHFPNVHCNM